MGGKHGQVALYVLIGVVLLVGVIIAVHIHGLQQEVSKSSTSDQSTQTTLGVEVSSPEVIAEKTRVQERLEHCLATVVEDALQHLFFVDTLSSEDFIRELEREIAERFTECQDMIGVIGHARSLSLPKVEAILGSQGVFLKIKQAYILEEAAIPFSDFETFIKGPFQRLLDLGSEIEDGTLTVFDNECTIDLYEFADENIYLDLLVSSEGDQYLELVTESDGVEYRRLVKLPPCEVTP